DADSKVSGSAALPPGGAHLAESQDRSFSDGRRHRHLDGAGSRLDPAPPAARTRGSRVDPASPAGGAGRRHREESPRLSGALADVTDALAGRAGMRPSVGRADAVAGFAHAGSVRRERLLSPSARLFKGN